MKTVSAHDILLSDDSRLLDDDELDAITGTSRTTRWRLRRKGEWPPRISLGGKSGNTLKQVRELMRKAEERSTAA